MISKFKNFLFKNLTPRQTVAKNIFWLSLSQVGSRFFRAIIIIYAARVLGAAEYGIFAYVLAFAGFFTLFSDIGVNAILTKNVASYPEQKDKYFSTSFWLKIILLLISALLVIFVAPHFSKIEKAVILFPLMALIVFFDGLREFANAFLRGLEKMEREAIVVITMNIVIMVAGFIILRISPTSKSLLFSYIASVGFSALLAIWIVKKQFLKVFNRRCLDLKTALQILNSAWPLAFSALLGTFMLNTDVIMLGWWRTAEEIGYYSIGQRVIGILYTLPALLMSGIFPTLSRFVQQNEKEREKNLNEKSTAVIFLMAFPLIIGGIVLSQPIIKFIFGSAYLPATPAFQILIACLFWIFPSVFLSNLVLAHNQQKKVVIYMASSALGNIILNIILIPLWGIKGAAISTFITQAIYVIPTWRRVKKISEFQTFRHLKKIIAAAIIMGIAAFFLNRTGLPVLINISVSAGVYLGTLYLLKEKILEEILILFRRFREAPSQ